MEFSLTLHAERQLGKLPRPVQLRIIEALERAASTGHPKPRKLKDSKLYRLRVGDYRLRGRFTNRAKSVFVIESIRHRSTAYR